MRCESGWERQRRNAELEDAWSHSESLWPSKTYFKKLNHRKFAVVMYHDVNCIDIEHNLGHQAEVGSCCRSKQLY